MNTFSISQLEQYSGIKAHTIRIWEKRYNALKPLRSDGNTRYYDNSQFRRLLNISTLINSGYKVSEVCKMTDENMFKLIEDNLNNNSSIAKREQYLITQLITAGISYDEGHFDKIFSNCLLWYDVKNIYIKIIYPMLDRIGLMWASDIIPPLQEHFITNLIRQKLSSAIDLIPPVTFSDESWVLFLPENEFHEIGLLFSHFLIKASGKKVYYFGSNVPHENLTEIIKTIEPTNLMFFLVHYDQPENAQFYINTLAKNFKKQKIHLAGNKKLIENLSLGKEIKWHQSVQDLEKELI